MLTAFNAPVPSDVEQALMAGAKQVQVFEDGIPKVYRLGDVLPSRTNSIQYFAKEVPLDFSLAYVDIAEQDTTKEQKVVFWEPHLYPATTVFMGIFHDGMSHSVWSASQDSPYTWINVRIYNDPEYPGCFFDYYADHRNVLRRLMAYKDEDRWDFGQEGPIQPFENPGYYARRLKKDRLNREIITEYMKQLGFLIAQDDFWETDKPAHFLWQERPRNKGVGETKEKQRGRELNKKV
jgi:hypothetical protein